MFLYQPEGAQVIGDFFDIFRDTDREPGLFIEQVSQRSLRPLDLGGVSKASLRIALYCNPSTDGTSPATPERRGNAISALRFCSTNESDAKAGFAGGSECGTNA